MHVSVRIVAVSFAIATLSGCLFPSLDNLEGPGPAQQPGGAPGSVDGGGVGAGQEGGAPSSSDGGAPGSTNNNNTTTDGGSPVVKATITCGGTNGCDVGTSYCCVGGGSTSTCLPKNEIAGCIAAMFCDENKDCAPNQKCCASWGKAECRSSCDEITDELVCNPSSPDCPNGETCKATQTGGGTTLFICQ